MATKTKIAAIVKNKGGAPKKEVSLATLAQLWGQSIPAVANDLKRLGLTIAGDGLEACTRAKMQALRDTARGYTSASGDDMQALKARETQTRIELNELEIAKQSGQLINVSQLEPMLAGLVVAARTEFLGRDDKLKEEIDLLYCIDVDVDLIKKYTEESLEHIAGYATVLYGSDAADTEQSQAAPEDFDDGVGTQVSRPKREVKRKAG
jgi:hypothetical protein